MHRSVRRIILIRHGESIGNIDASAYGRLPDNQQELTTWGEEQAVRAGKRLRSILTNQNEDCRFFISPYKRSHQTFELISKQLSRNQFSVVEDPRLREQDWGNFQDVDHMSWQQRERRRFGVFYYRFSDGESGADVYDRVSSFLETLCRDSFRSKPSNYVLISHGITIRMFLARFYHWPVDIVNKLHNFYNGQTVVMERCLVTKDQYSNVHLPQRKFIREPSFNETEFIDTPDFQQFHKNYDEIPNHDPKMFDEFRSVAQQQDDKEYCGVRFLLTSLLMSDPPGPPEQDICWEKIEERRKTSSPLLGL